MRGIQTRSAYEGQVEVDWEEYGETVKKLEAGYSYRRWQSVVKDKNTVVIEWVKLQMAWAR